jgi:hypothetical protein
MSRERLEYERILPVQFFAMRIEAALEQGTRRTFIPLDLVNDDLTLCISSFPNSSRSQIRQKRLAKSHHAVAPMLPKKNQNHCPETHTQTHASKFSKEIKVSQSSKPPPLPSIFLRKPFPLHLLLHNPLRITHRLLPSRLRGIGSFLLERVLTRFT